MNLTIKASLAAGLALCCFFANAQQDFRKISVDALTLARAGNRDSAVQTVRNGLNACPQFNPGKDCRALLNYSMGFIEQQAAESAKNSELASSTILRARRSYEASLVDDPDNSVVLFNLALLSLSSGDTDGAIQELRRAAEDDPVRAWKYYMKLGDIYSEKKNYSSALVAYSSAASAALEEEAPQWRVVGVAIAAGVPPETLVQRCESLEASFPEVAGACYERVLNASYWNKYALAERSFLAWVTLLADRDRLTESSLRALPQQWNVDQVDMVRRILGGYVPTSVPGWWQAPDQRRKAFATMMLFAGRRVGAKPECAESCWRTGIAAVRNLYEGAAGSGMPLAPAVTVNLYQELALLYVRYPSFDPGQSKLQNLLRDIFDQKGLAIQSHNLEAEQRFHNVLGIIFVQQKRWGSDGDPYAAPYQLRRTIEVANQRFKSEGVYQPLPQVKELLAFGYKEHQKSDQANSSLWDAALAYMDSDDLSDSARIIAQLPDNGKVDKKSLTNILSLRQQAIAGSAAPELISQCKSLAASPSVPAGFIQRQQFKILADVVRKSPIANDETTLQHALDAFDLVTDKGTPLVGVGDSVRWQAVQHRLLDSVGARESVDAVHGRATVLKLSLPGQTSTQRVEVPETTIHSVQILRIVGPQNLLHLHSKVSYDGTTFSLPAGSLVTNQAAARLKAAGVRVRPN